MKGKIIVIEGTDCSGKETQSVLLEKRLKEQGKKCVHFGFPMYDSPTGRIVGGPYLGNPEISAGFFKEGADKVDPHIASLYYAADRKYNMEKILPYLNDGYYVILDRYTTSNLAHQGSKIQDKEWLLQLPKPDYTIFLHMPYQYSLELRKNRKVIDENERSEEHLKNAEDAYIELSEMYNWKRIECVKDGVIRDVSDINDEILEYLESI